LLSGAHNQFSRTYFGWNKWWNTVSIAAAIFLAFLTGLWYKIHFTVCLTHRRYLTSLAAGFWAQVFFQFKRWKTLNRIISRSKSQHRWVITDNCWGSLTHENGCWLENVSLRKFCLVKVFLRFHFLSYDFIRRMLL
jgi:hypothetical protein